MIGFYDSNTRAFLDSAIARALPGKDDNDTDMIRAAEARLAVFSAHDQRGTTQRRTDDGAGLTSSTPLWFSAGDYVVGIGKPVAGVFPVMAFPGDLRENLPKQHALLRIGMAYVYQQLTEDIYSRPIWPEGLVEATMQILSIGFFLVTANCEVRYDGSQAKDLAADDPVWPVVNGRLTLHQEKERTLLQEAIRNATTEDPRASIISVSTASGLMRLAVVAPLANTRPRMAIVLFERHRSDHAALREHFFNAHGLTRSERLIAHEVLDGKTLNEAAEVTKLSLATVRSYMKQIFAKTGTHRQSELISSYYTAILPVGTTIAKAEARRLQ